MRQKVIEITAAALSAIMFIGCYASSSFDDDVTSSTTSTTQSEDYAANVVVDNFMLSYYLYNSEYSEATRNLSQGYYNMFYGALLATDGNVLDKKVYDEEAGTYTIYSSISRSAATTKSSSSYSTMNNSLGFVSLEYLTMTIDGAKKTVLGVCGVYTDSPASEASITRGDIITAINGISVSILYATGSSTLSEITSPSEGQEFQLTLYDWEEDVTLTTDYIETNPVLYALEVSEGIGYLNLCSFNYYFYNSMLSALETLKSADISELILDLRLNKGGHISASNLLTAGLVNSSSRDIFCYYRFNDDLTSTPSTTASSFSVTYDSSNSLFYEYYTSYLSSSYKLDLDRVYVLTSEDTASASELLINALKCSDVDVILIGTTTHGKNVGSQSSSFTSGDYTYSISPIMFELFNGDMEGDYYDGFDPDYEVYEYSDFRNYGTSEPLIAKALELAGWSKTATQTATQTASTRSMDDAIEPTGKRLRDPQLMEGAEIMSKN